MMTLMKVYKKIQNNFKKKNYQIQKKQKHFQKLIIKKLNKY